MIVYPIGETETAAGNDRPETDVEDTA